MIVTLKARESGEVEVVELRALELEQVYSVLEPAPFLRRAPELPQATHPCDDNSRKPVALM